jgi:succinoglycan biosynthesis transport protein ExoP
MGPRQILRLLRARRVAFLSTLVGVLLATLIASLVMPKSYRATVALLVDSQDQQSLGEPLRQLMLPQEHFSFLQTQNDILTSRKVADRLVRDLKLPERADVLSALGVSTSGHGRDAEHLAELLQKQLKTELSQSDVVQASIATTDPAVSAMLANGFATAYAETLLDLRVAPTREAAAWFDVQLSELRRTLELGQAKLTDFYRKRGISPSDPRYSSAGAIDALSGGLGGSRNGATGLGAGRGGGAATGTAESPDLLPEVAGNPFVQQLKTETLHAEERLEELSTQYGENHPAYQRQLSQVRASRARLQTEIGRLLGASANGAARGVPRDSDLQRAFERQRAHQLDVMERDGELALLRRDVESAERAYDTARQRYLVSQVNSRAQTASVEVLSAATPPTTAYKPKLALNLALGLISGTILAGAMVVLLESVDRRVRSAEDFVNAVHLPLLAVIGENGGSSHLLLAPPRSAVRALPRPPAAGVG